MVQALTSSCCSSSATSLHTLRTSLIVRQIGGWNLQRSLSWQMLDATGKEQKSRFSCFRALSSRLSAARQAEGASVILPSRSRTQDLYLPNQRWLPVLFSIRTTNASLLWAGLFEIHEKVTRKPLCPTPYTPLFVSSAGDSIAYDLRSSLVTFDLSVSSYSTRKMKKFSGCESYSSSIW
jgi:hypothetical protein